MDTQRSNPKFRFRVLIIGRANAGKTSILQRVCETTDSPIFYRIFRGLEKVKLNPSMDRGEHRIDDELVFSNHKGYVFHDSRGIESGSTEELEVLKTFIRRKCRETRLYSRLHAIWYCVPMDNQRPQLDLKFFQDICPDRNVPVIVVFTKFDQFRRNVQIHVEDFGSPDDNVLDVMEKQFQEHYLRPLGDDVRFVRLEKMHKKNTRCNDLIEKTAASLHGDIVSLMLLAVQRSNLELSVKTALSRIHPDGRFEDKVIVEECLISFPYIWHLDDRGDGDDLGRKLGDDFDFSYFRLYGLDGDKKKDYRREDRDKFNRLVTQILSLPTIQNLSATSLGGYHLIFAVIIILKHATFLRLSNMSPESALTHAELDYHEANIDSKIQLHLLSPQEHSVEFFASFIMATDMSSVKTRANN